jgi:C-terminal processing protease CtpA/Prc
MRAHFIVSILVLAAWASAQQVAEPYSAGVTLLSPDNCPIFVAEVVAGSPAGRAGIRAGDHLLAVDDTHLSEGSQAAQLLKSNVPTTVTLTLMRDGREITVVSERAKRSSFYTNKAGYKTISGLIVPADTTQAEVDRMNAFDGRRLVGRVFPTHYPASPELFYAGFELFILRDPAQVTVGGIEEGPASKAGVHWGDVLTLVNGVPIAGKTPSELEQMFTAARPAPMRLQIDRLGTARTFEFHIEKAAQIALQNGRRIEDGHLVPMWATGQDVQ